jgi:uncharacterized membrane protein HdeD (DUF308 family)
MEIKHEHVGRPGFGAIEPVGAISSWALGLGVAMVVLGIVAILAAAISTVVSVVLLGVLVLAGGLAQALHAAQGHRWTGTLLSLGVGILYVIVGLLMITRPISSAIGLTLLMAVLFFVSGLFRGIIALAERFPSWGWVLVSSIVSVALGVLIWAGLPFAGLFLIGLFVGIELVVHGVAWIALGVTARGLKAGA